LDRASAVLVRGGAGRCCDHAALRRVVLSLGAVFGDIRPPWQGLPLMLNRKD
jgi:hypothetical protein